MNSEKRLTREIAEEFLSDEDSVDLDEFTELDDTAAESLCKYQGWLWLNGLTSLSGAAAGLTSLSDAAAKWTSPGIVGAQTRA